MTAAIFFGVMASFNPFGLGGAITVFTGCCYLAGAQQPRAGVVPESWTVINTSQLEGTIPCVRTV